VADAVWKEVTAPRRLRDSDIRALGNVRRHAVKTSIVGFVSENSLDVLQVGECEALWLARELRVGLVLTDDLAAREAAKALQIRPVGSLGIVARAYLQGLISLDLAERYMLDLYERSSLFVTTAIVEVAIADLRRWTCGG